MSIHLAFAKPAFNIDAPFLGRVRASEAVAAAGTGALTAEDGDVVVVTNIGTAVLYVAHGSTPDASATAETDATSARYAVPAGATIPTYPKPGDKFAVAAS